MNTFEQLNKQIEESKAQLDELRTQLMNRKIEPEMSKKQITEMAVNRRQIAIHLCDTLRESVNKIEYLYKTVIELSDKVKQYEEKYGKLQ